MNSTDWSVKCCVFRAAAVIHPLKPEHLAAKQLRVGSVMSWGCHRPPSPPRAALHPRAEPWINPPAGLSFTCFLPVHAINIFFVFVFLQQLIPKCFGFAQSTRDLFRPRYFLRFVSYNRKWASLGVPVSRVIVDLVYLFVSWIMWKFFFPPWVPICKKAGEATFSESHHRSPEETTAVRISWCY